MLTRSLHALTFSTSFHVLFAVRIMLTLVHGNYILLSLSVVNKDVTAEEVQRVDDLVTYLEGQNSEDGLQKQVSSLLTLNHVTRLVV